MKVNDIKKFAMSQPETERTRTYFLTGLVKKFSPHREITRMATEKRYNYGNMLLNCFGGRAGS